MDSVAACRAMERGCAPPGSSQSCAVPARNGPPAVAMTPSGAAALASRWRRGWRSVGSHSRTASVPRRGSTAKSPGVQVHRAQVFDKTLLAVAAEAQDEAVPVRVDDPSFRRCRQVDGRPAQRQPFAVEGQQSGADARHQAVAVAHQFGKTRGLFEVSPRRQPAALRCHHAYRFARHVHQAMSIEARALGNLAGGKRGRRRSGR